MAKPGALPQNGGHHLAMERPPMAFTRYDSLKGRTVVVTGGASGIGAAFVRAFAENGARVAFLDLQRDAGATLADAVAQGAEKPLFVPCDLTDIAALRAALDTIRAALGPAAVLVNNAANDQRYDFASITPEEFDRTIAVNFRHVFFAAQAIVPQMRELGHGSIVNMSSVSWMRGIPLLEAYASAKAAIVGFTNTLARAVGAHRIRVNAIAPGMVLTERQRRLWFQDESQIETGRAQQCLPDLIAPEDIANLALFLAADDSRLITRQCISVNGGVL
jgi:NAD(P)-dependent dehydrogenase (short-subunit alcohol dehydrogenase family)